ncbi:MAG: HlyD family efflux transporter periplasmic adaptor subunit [Nevskia sp.]
MNRFPAPPRAVAACLLAAASLVACARKPAPPPPAVETGLVAAAPGWVDVEGGLRRLGLRTDGVVRHVAVHEGDHVQAGAVLIELDDARARLDGEAAALDLRRRGQELAALRTQQARLAQTIQRLQPLVAQQAEPADELRQLQDQRAAGAAQIALAETAVHAAVLQARMNALAQAQAQLRAPVTGDVLRVLVHDGDAVTAGTPLLWLAGDGALQVRAELDERLLGAVTAGMTAEVSSESGSGPVFKAKVLRVARVIGPVRSLPEIRPAAQDDRVVECLLAVDGRGLIVGQRVLVRIFKTP